MEVAKKKWVSPKIRRFGTFEVATQDCFNKESGIGDAWTFQQQPTAIACGS